MTIKNILLIALMQGGRAPVGKTQFDVINQCYPERDGLKITLVGGLSWVDPGEIVKTFGKNTAVATIYKRGDEWFVDKVDGRRLNLLGEMMKSAKPGESSWDVAMRFHELELAGK